MNRLLRPFALMTTTIAAGAVLVAPGAAHAADTTTRLSADQMQTALWAVSETSTAATRQGWQSVVSTITNSEQSLRGSYTVDAADGIVSVNIRSAMKMIGRPAVRYVFIPEKPNLDAYIHGNIPSPKSILAEDVNYAGTRTTHDDGSTDYRFTADNGATVILHVDPNGVLTKVRGSVTGAPFALALQYGPHRVTLPAAGVTVDAATLRNAVAYLDMPDAVKTAAGATCWSSRSDTGAAADAAWVFDGNVVVLTRIAGKIHKRDAAAHVTTAGQVA